MHEWSISPDYPVGDGFQLTPSKLSFDAHRSKRFDGLFNLDTMRLPSIASLLLLLGASLYSAERNIIFIVTDDQSPTLGCYGDPVAYSPAVDSLAADGTLFHRAYATTASCSASRSVILSGLHNHFNGQFGHQHAYHKFSSFHNVVSLSLPRALSRAGYRTGQIGKYHVAPEEVYRFDAYLKGNARNAAQMAKVAESFIASDDPRPFFLYFATSDPHRGGGLDKNFSGALKPNLFGNLPNEGAYEGIDERIYDPAEVPVPPYLPDTLESRSELAHYYQSCARIDQGVAKLISILKERDLYDKTLIVFTADHGMAFAGAKTTVFEAGLHVPFIVRDPYQKRRGVESHAMISHIDIAPSLIDFVQALDRKANRPQDFQEADDYWADQNHARRDNRGHRPFESYHGKSWIPILGDPNATHRETLFASHTFHEITMYYPMRAVWDGQYKLIWNIASGLPYPFASDLWASSTWQAQLAQGGDALYGYQNVDSYVNRPAFELYDVTENRYENVNLASNPDYAPILEAMKRKLKDFQGATNDPWISKWEYE